jgi:GT2 family glycosyltransferase
MGDRPAELRRALDSVAAQDGDPAEVVVVGNGVDVPDLPGSVRFLRLSSNEGIPGGRNAGSRESTGELVFFLDDDGWLPETHTLEQVRGEFARRPRLGIVSLRIRDPETGASMRRHVPRLRAGDPGRSSDVTTFLGGASVVRRRVLEDCGWLPDAFFFAHEETDLAWRALDAGWSIRYDADAVMCHPATAASRHEIYYRLNARNRVWLARRNLPAPLLAAYLAVWCVLTLARNRDPVALRTWFKGFAEGWRTDPGPRRPMTWRTAWRMTRLGRPPVI